jgi:hypothetical protein
MRVNAVSPGRRNVYVREQDVEVWAGALQLAQRDGLSSSALLAAALREYVEAHADQPPKPPQRMTAHVSVDGYREIRPAELEERR